MKWLGAGLNVPRSESLTRQSNRMSLHITTDPKARVRPDPSQLSAPDSNLFSAHLDDAFQCLVNVTSFGIVVISTASVPDSFNVSIGTPVTPRTVFSFIKDGRVIPRPDTVKPVCCLSLKVFRQHIQICV